MTQSAGDSVPLTPEQRARLDPRVHAGRLEAFLVQLPADAHRRARGLTNRCS